MSFLTIVFGAKVLKILQICVFSPPNYCKKSPKGGGGGVHGHPRTPPCYALALHTTLHILVYVAVNFFYIFNKVIFFQQGKFNVNLGCFFINLD